MRRLGKGKLKLVIPIIIVVVIIVGIIILTNINVLNKLRANVFESINTKKETKESICDVENISDSYIKITGTIEQDYGEDGLATITFTDGNKSFTKELEVKTNSKTKLDFTLSKGEYNLTISKEGYDVYEGKINTSQELNITLHNKNVGDVVATGQVGDNVYYNYYSNGLLQLKGTGDMWDGLDTDGNIFNYNGFILNDVVLKKIENSNIKLTEQEKEDISNLLIGEFIGSASEYMEIMETSKEGLENGTCPDENNSDCDVATSFLMYFNKEETLKILDAIISIPINTKVVINDGITYLGSYAFAVIQSNEFIIPNSVIKYGDEVFAASSIEKLVLSKNAKEIPSYFFDGTNDIMSIGLKELVIPYGVTKINDNAFRGNKLTNLTIPNSVTYLSGFEENNDLTTLKIGNKVKEIGNEAFYKTNIAMLDIPPSVEKIGDSAFYNVKINDLNLNEGLIEIGNYAFYENAIVDLKLPNSVEKIGNYAFANNKNLESISIGKNMKEIGSYSFGKLNSLNLISYNAKELSDYPRGFWGQSYSENIKLMIGKDVKVIPNYLFSFSKSNSGTTTVSPITELVINNGVEKIGEDAFSGNRLKKIYIPNSVNIIESYAFEFCSIEELTLGSNVKKIGDSAFRSNYNLTKLIIPSSVESIGSYAFKQCYLDTLIINGERTRFNQGWYVIGFPENLKPNN